MPDLDVIDRKAPRGWASSFKLFVGDASPAEVRRAVTKALAGSLRENGGFAGGDEFHDILRRRLSGELDAHSALEAVTAIEHRLGHNRHAKIGARAVKKLLIEMGQDRRAGAVSFNSLCERFVSDLVDNLFFGRILPDVVGRKRYPGRAEVAARESAVREALGPSLRKIGRMLVVDPSAEDLRAPPTFIDSQPTTEEMLDQPIM